MGYAGIEWIKYTKADLDSGWKISFNRVGVDVTGDGVVSVGSRMAELLKATRNRI